MKVNQIIRRTGRRVAAWPLSPRSATRLAAAEAAVNAADRHLRDITAGRRPHQPGSAR
ncbi:MAG: hypothetical protein ACLP52_14215 [Streptosporangiaceae bacterium]